MNFPFALALNDNELFIAENSGAILKFELNSLSLEDLEFNKVLSTYPNPSTQFISITNLKSKVPYIIYNAIGAEISSGVISNNEKIDIKTFVNGLYFLKLKNENTIKFIKK